MKTMFKKSIRLCLCLNLFMIGALMAQHTYEINDKTANKVWEELKAKYDAVYSVNDSSWKSNDNKLKIAYWSRFEKASNDFREAGLEFWNRFPNDKRRYEWFERTTNDSWLNLFYWKEIDSGVLKYKIIRATPSSSYNAAIDWDKLNAWEKKYPKMRSEYLTYVNSLKPKDAEEKKGNLHIKELENFLKLSLNKEYRKGNKIDLLTLKQLFRSTAPFLGKLDWSDSATIKFYNYGVLRAMDNDFIAIYKEYGLDAKDMKAFFSSLINVPDKAVQNWAIQRNSLFQLMEDPLQLKHTAIDGREIDLEKLRGKVVLVDFWSVWCTSCVARMPAIKHVYDKYKNQGFEVISICLNNDDKLEQVKGIEKKIGADWPVLLIGSSSKEDSLGQRIWKKYGFFGVPQLLLLDKSGKLALLNDRLRDGDFDPILKKLLNEKI